VELRNRFIRETFGRYLSDEVVEAVLESPAGLQLGGEKRKITMLMADLRGFTSLSERLPPERVVAMVNRYLSTMVGVIKRYNGTIDDFIGDAIFVLFGAPVWKEDDAERAVACAIAMQVAMDSINEQNRREDLPEIEMGVGVHTGQVVVGNIGSPERMKYDVMGSQVNLTSRIQSCTTGGQILISETTRQEVGRILKVGRRMEVKAKGVEHPVTLFEALGISGSHKLLLPDASEQLVPLILGIPLRYEIVEAIQLGHEAYKGTLMKLSRKAAEATLDRPIGNLTNVKIYLMQDGRDIPGALYAKVIDAVPGGNQYFFHSLYLSITGDREILAGTSCG
jgi:adenylate cyclase